MARVFLKCRRTTKWCAIGALVAVFVAGDFARSASWGLLAFSSPYRLLAENGEEDTVEVIAETPRPRARCQVRALPADPSNWPASIVRPVNERNSPLKNPSLARCPAISNCGLRLRC